MKTQNLDIEHVKKTFNRQRIIKGQYANIATSDEQGTPNVAPIGSMRMVDDETVHIVQGFLPRTMANLKQNPKATFSICFLPKVSDFFQMFRSADDETLGYQVYCTWLGASEKRTDIETEVAFLEQRVPFFMRGAMRRFMNKNLKRVLTFHVDGIRPIGDAR